MRSWPGTSRALSGWGFTPRWDEAAAESSSVPCGLIFNECPRDDWVNKAIGAGFNLVMLADPAASYTDYVARVAAIVRLAHARGVAVEGELGELPCGAGADGGLPAGGTSTDPARRGRIRGSRRVSTCWP